VGGSQQDHMAAIRRAAPIEIRNGVTPRRRRPVVKGPIADKVRCGKNLSYSITSSAVASSVAGTMRPSALAVLRLITTSYLRASCTGRSAGLPPHATHRHRTHSVSPNAQR
jgi:hypothetical protein